MNDLGSSGIEILIQVFFEVPDGHAELIARDGLILDILRLAERLGIAFDSPTLLLDRNGQASPALEVGKAGPLRHRHSSTGTRSGSHVGWISFRGAGCFFRVGILWVPLFGPGQAVLEISRARTGWLDCGSGVSRSGL